MALFASRRACDAKHDRHDHRNEVAHIDPPLDRETEPASIRKRFDELIQVLLPAFGMSGEVVASARPGHERSQPVNRPHAAHVPALDEALRHMRYEIHVPEDIRVKAKRALDRMLEAS